VAQIRPPLLEAKNYYGAAGVGLANGALRSVIMKWQVVLAAIIGFLVPLICGFVQMLLFNAKDTAFANFLCYQLPYWMCPPWGLGNGSAFWFVAIPFLNSALYGSIIYLWIAAKRRLQA
jgi:hypothetical protein